jgi:hypothetical protein
MKAYTRKNYIITEPNELPTAEEVYNDYVKNMERVDNEINEEAKAIFSSPEYLALNFPDGLPLYEDIDEPGAITPTGLYVPKG